MGRRFEVSPMIQIILLASILTFTAVLALEGFSAARPDDNEQAYAGLSEGHRGLISMFKARSAATGGQTVKLRRPRAQRLNGIAPITATVPSEPDRIYTAPSPEEAALIAGSLAYGLRRLEPDADHLPLLNKLNRLANLSAPASASLASAGDELPEPTVEETEPNDSRESAQEISFGDVVAASSVPERDLDIFTFEAEAGDYVRIDVRPEGDGWVTALLLDADSNLVSGGNYSVLEDYSSPVDSRSFAPIWIGGNVIGTTLENGGTYFIVVQSFPGSIRYLDNFTETLDDAVTDTEQEVSYRLELTNPPTYELSGQVLDDSESPVAEAEVLIWPHDGTGTAQAVTDENGTFVLALPEGDYSATVESPAGSRYPSGQAREQFRVGEGGTQLRFVLRSGVIFSGQAVDDRGMVVPNLSFSLIDRENNQYRWAVTDEEGLFSVALFPGTCDIYLHATRQYPPQPVIRRVEILQDTEYTILVDTGNLVSGRVLDPDGSPVALVSLSFFGRTDNRYARSDDQGFYEVALTTGSYYITAVLPADVPLPSQEVGTLTVEEDMEFDINLAAGGIISGMVIDSRGNAVAGAGIDLRQIRTDTGEDEKPETGDETFAGEGTDSVYTDNLIAPRLYHQPFADRWLSTDTQGRWQAAVMPGSYTIEVVVSGNYPYQRLQAGVFEVGEGETVETPVVTIEHGTLFSGHVFLPDGSPMERGLFQMTTSRGNQTLDESDIGLAPEPMPPIYRWNSYLVPVGADGGFEVRVFPGTYCLGFDRVPGADGYPFQTICDLNLDRDLEMDINLDAGYLVSGRVIDPEQTGLEGCWLNFYSDDGFWRGGSSMSGSDGSFEIRLVAGDYYLMVQPVKGYFPDSLVQKLSLTGDTSLDIVLRPGVRVFGRVTAGDGHPLSGVIVHLVPHTVDNLVSRDDLADGGSAGSDSVVIDGESVWFLSPAALGLVDEDIPEPLKAAYDEGSAASDESLSDRGFDSGFAGPLPLPGVPDGDAMIGPWPYWGWDAVAWSDLDGYFEVRVRPEVYDLYAWASEPGYAGVQLPGLDCTSELEVNLTLETADITITGEVKDPSGDSADSILVSVYDVRTGNHQVVYTDNSGSFEMRLATGVYELYVDGTDRYGRVELIESLELDSDRSLKLRLGTGLLDDHSDAFDSAAQLPQAFSMTQNSPNPFNPSTTISYTVGQPTQVSLVIYDLRGRQVKTLVDRFVEGGTYQIQWYGTDSRGRPVASGVYFYRLQANDYNTVRKMVLLK